MQDQVIEVPLVEPVWYHCSGRPNRLTDGHLYGENVARQLKAHRRTNAFTSNGVCTESQARSMGRRIRPSQRGNCALVWFRGSSRPARFYNENQLE